MMLEIIDELRKINEIWNENKSADIAGISRLYITQWHTKHKFFGNKT